jgi:hypothetical protein
MYGRSAYGTDVKVIFSRSHCQSGRWLVISSKVLAEVQMVSYASLNRRHKVGLFLTLVVAGFSLLPDASARQTAGVILLGLAATWLVGSMALRTLWFAVSAIVFTAGLSIAVFPVWLDWNVYQGHVHDYESAITDLRAAVAESRTLQVADYAILQSGQRIEITGYERVGETFRLATTGGTLQIPATSLQRVESEPLPPLPKGYKLIPPKDATMEPIPRTVNIPETVSQFMRRACQRQ